MLLEDTRRQLGQERLGEDLIDLARAAVGIAAVRRAIWTSFGS